MVTVEGIKKTTKKHIVTEVKEGEEEKTKLCCSVLHLCFGTAWGFSSAIISKPVP